jgi:hypothetical protein
MFWVAQVSAEGPKACWHIAVVIGGAIFMSQVPVLAEGRESELRRELALAILERAARAHGGEAKLAKSRAMRVKVEGKSLAKGHNLPATLEETWRLPHQYRFELTIEYTSDSPSTWLGLVEKGGGWYIDHRNRARNLERGEAARLKDSGYTEPLVLLYLLKDERPEVSALGTAKFDGKDAWGVLIKLKGRRERTLGNRRPKRTHIGEQTGPTGVRGYTCHRRLWGPARDLALVLRGRACYRRGAG